MNESKDEYYKRMCRLALEKRKKYSLSTKDISLSSIRKIYRSEGIQIDSWPRRLRKVKAAYFNDEDGCSVLLDMNLPEEPRLFAMIHELKHHYEDQGNLRCFCDDVYDSSPLIEIGAEVFAAEFIFPDDEFREYVPQFYRDDFLRPEDMVRMKYHCPARVSYQYLQKKLTRLGYITAGQFANVQFQKLHETLYGSHHYHKRQR